MTIKGRTVGFVGAGNMGEALIKGLVVANVVPAKSIAATPVTGPEMVVIFDLLVVCVRPVPLKLTAAVPGPLSAMVSVPPLGLTK